MSSKVLHVIRVAEKGLTQTREKHITKFEICERKKGKFRGRIVTKQVTPWRVLFFSKPICYGWKIESTHWIFLLGGEVEKARSIAGDEILWKNGAAHKVENELLQELEPCWISKAPKSAFESSSRSEEQSLIELLDELLLVGLITSSVADEMAKVAISVMVE